MTNDTPERIAQIVYERGMRYLRNDAPSWELGGNSLAQGEARAIAHQVLEIVQAEKEAAVAAEREACAAEADILEGSNMNRAYDISNPTLPFAKAKTARLIAQSIRDRANTNPLAAPAARDARELSDSFFALCVEGTIEADRAMKKFPQPNYVISKVAEEAGEVVKAAIHCAEDRESAREVRTEMKQLIAMLYRLWVEGDQVHGLPPLIPADQEGEE